MAKKLLSSGKRLHNYGKSQFLMDLPTINGDFQQLCKRLPGRVTCKDAQDGHMTDQLGATLDKQLSSVFKTGKNVVEPWACPLVN